MSLILSIASAALYSNYMLVPAFVLALIGGLALAAQRGIQRRPGPFLASMLAAGAVVGFVAVLRTNYGLVCLLLSVAFVIYVFRDLHPRRTAAAGMAALALFVLVGARRAAIQLVNGPILALGLDYNRVHHPIAHPLVLALGQPDSPLATREGIRWDDSVGLPLAQKIEPSATYLGPAYEKALLSYYAKLWIFHPGEMIGIYLAKWHESVRGAFGDAELPSAHSRVRWQRRTSWHGTESSGSSSRWRPWPACGAGGTGCSPVPPPRFPAPLHGVVVGCRAGPAADRHERGLLRVLVFSVVVGVRSTGRNMVARG